jgi:hypothetical protein
MANPIVHEGKLKAVLAPTVANLNAPTAAEIAAGIDLEPALTADGISPSHTENLVSTETLSGFIRQSIGTEGVAFDLTFLRYAVNGTDNEAWDYFDARGKVGVLILASEGSLAAGSVAECYPVESGRRKRLASGANAHQKFTVKFAGTDDYVDDAVVAV